MLPFSGHQALKGLTFPKKTLGTLKLSFWQRFTMELFRSNNKSNIKNFFPHCRLLKEPRNCILRILCVSSSFCSIRVCISLQILPCILLKNCPFYVFFGFILTKPHDIHTNHCLSKCHLWFCSYFIKAICKFVRT